jgi:sulfur-carrier protein adenylyltransferase/sulfurtransferase
VENLSTPTQSNGAPPVSSFSYDEAFSRNLGWITPLEQQILRGKRIAIAGCGGVGGSHLLTLTRLGIGAFNIADFDRFELANFNRQAGAMVSTLGQPKVDTLARMATDINPTIDIRKFPQGVDDTNLEEFLDGVDCYVDSLDFFVLELRLKLFARLKAKGIPAVIAGPIGLGTGYLVFLPEKMSFDEYFRLSGLPAQQQYVNFLLGLTPRLFQLKPLVDKSRVDLSGQRGPSTGLACELCAGVTAAEVMKILLNRGKVRAAPHYHQFDPYSEKFVKGWIPGGNGNPLQRLKLALGYRQFEKASRNAPPRPAEPPADELSAILNEARWAPSADNIQPWRFKRVEEDRIAIEILRSDGIYDYRDGEPTLLAAGALIESIRIAASVRGRGCVWRWLGSSENGYNVSVKLPRDQTTQPDPLHPFLPIRSVDRRPYRTTPLTQEQRSALGSALGDGSDLSIEWYESKAERRRRARANAIATDIRLRLRAAYDVHREVVDFKHAFSQVGIPAGAIGLDPVLQRLMQSLMGNWKRVDWMNRWAFGTVLPRLEMDVLPGISCAAHFAIRTRGVIAPAERPSFLLRAGGAIQRLWLTATSHDLAMQPTLAALCFASYAQTEAHWLSDPMIARKAQNLLRPEMDQDWATMVFSGRLGTPRDRKIVARSMRRDLSALLM